MEDANEGVLSGEKLTDALFDAFPSLREWRNFRIGLIAALIEIPVWFALFSDIDLEIRLPLPVSLLFHLRMGLFVAFIACMPIALVGLIVDKKKTASAVALGAVYPATFLLAMWSGSW